MLRSLSAGAAAAESVEAARAQVLPATSSSVPSKSGSLMNPNSNSFLSATFPQHMLAVPSMLSTGSGASTTPTATPTATQRQTPASFDPIMNAPESIFVHGLDEMLVARSPQDCRIGIPAQHQQAACNAQPNIYHHRNHRPQRTCLCGCKAIADSQNAFPTSSVGYCCMPFPYLRSGSPEWMRSPQFMQSTTHSSAHPGTVAIESTSFTSRLQQVLMVQPLEQPGKVDLLPSSSLPSSSLPSSSLSSSLSSSPGLSGVHSSLLPPGHMRASRLKQTPSYPPALRQTKHAIGCRAGPCNMPLMMAVEKGKAQYGPQVETQFQEQSQTMPHANRSMPFDSTMHTRGDGIGRECESTFHGMTTIVGTATSPDTTTPIVDNGHSALLLPHSTSSKAERPQMASPPKAPRQDLNGRRRNQHDQQRQRQCLAPLPDAPFRRTGVTEAGIAGDERNSGNGGTTPKERRQCVRKRVHFDQLAIKSTSSLPLASPKVLQSKRDKSKPPQSAQLRKDDEQLWWGEAESECNYLAAKSVAATFRSQNKEDIKHFVTLFDKCTQQSQPKVTSRTKTLVGTKRPSACAYTAASDPSLRLNARSAQHGDTVGKPRKRGVSMKVFDEYDEELLKRMQCCRGLERSLHPVMARNRNKYMTSMLRIQAKIDHMHKTDGKALTPDQKARFLCSKSIGLSRPSRTFAILLARHDASIVMDMVKEDLQSSLCMDGATGTDGR